MFNIVPSNRQEYLLQVLIELLNNDYTSGRLGIFEPSTVMVESLGMKHFIHMRIAQSCGVAMNIDFPLVSRGIYSLCRCILGEEQVPKESLYKREILTWRIEHLLRTEEFQQDPDAEHANAYWQQASDPEKACFILAQGTADVFEQYMQFRPEWFELWQHNQSIFSQDSAQQMLEPWQKKLWQMLVTTSDAYPAKIVKTATENFTPNTYQLPKVLYIFAVNALTPEQLTFLETIGQEVDIYFFHLNPCVEFWGDLVSTYALMKEKLEQGVTKLTDEDSPNTLLANLGKQGRVLFNQLQKIDYPDFTQRALFADKLAQEEAKELTVLSAIQQDLLQAQTGVAGKLPPDNSVSIHSCHSALREIQVLHDYLLQIIQNSDNSIKPHDIIVLCPAVEDYAPYVKSVFRGSYATEQDGNPQLVCSIADRAPLDADPMVSMFIDMLHLPDSRFSVTSLIDYLHIESVQRKFALTPSEVELCEKWISEANIYWGKDAEHKAAILQQEGVKDIYTWEWGLSRLLKSALFADEDADNLPFAMVNCVEGQSLSILGKLILFIETLQTIYAGLQTQRSMQMWLRFMLSEILEQLFAEKDDNRALATLKAAIEQINNNILKAKHEHQVQLSVAREALSNLLSKPDPVNQFNTGQVTFCSMVPMRSVPFEVVCILGLNDGVFPRSAQPLSIDLMVRDKARSTDRSRRSEDRYMFLEALISARQYLYLSYQGKSIKDNGKREPSLVLREFMDYLKQAFDCVPVTEHPLQPFSPKAYEKDKLTDSDWAQRPSFSSAWLKVANEKVITMADLRCEFELPAFIDADDLVSFYTDPLAAFAHHHLHLSFDRFVDAQDDTEPFEASGLVRYQINQYLIELAARQEALAFEQKIQQMHKAGDLPEISSHQDIYQQAYTGLAQAFAQDSYLDDAQEVSEFSTEIPINNNTIMLNTFMDVDVHNNSQILVNHQISVKDLFGTCIKHAIKRIASNKPVSTVLTFVDIKGYLKGIQTGDSKSSQPKIGQLELNDNNFDAFKAKAFLSTLLQHYQTGMQRPSMLHLELGCAANRAVIKAKQSNYQDTADIPDALNKVLDNEYFANDYVAYFFPDNVSAEHIDSEKLEQLYFAHLPQGWEC